MSSMSVSALGPIDRANQVPAFTPAGRDALAERAEHLRVDVLGPLRLLLVGPDRDERDVAAFERTLADIERLERLLAASVVLDKPRTGRAASVAPGALVDVREEGGETLTVRPVHPEEATIDDERISWDSPLGRALIGARVGERVEVPSPRGRWIGEVVRIRR